MQETVQETLQKSVEDTYHGFVLSPLINSLVAIIILIGIYDWWYRYQAHDNRVDIRHSIPTARKLPNTDQGLTYIAAGVIDADINSVRGR